MENLLKNNITLKGLVTDPTSVAGSKQHIGTVLRTLAAGENCDGEPYDQMMQAAAYIEHLEGDTTVDEVIRIELPGSIKAMVDEVVTLSGSSTRGAAAIAALAHLRWVLRKISTGHKIVAIKGKTAIELDAPYFETARKSV